MPVLPFESIPQQHVYERLRPMLEEPFGPVRERIHAIGYAYEIDGMTVTTTLAPWDDDVVIANRAYLAGAVPDERGCAARAGAWTEAGRFGAFGVDDADNVYFEHQLLGSTVTTDSLGRSMRAAHASPSAAATSSARASAAATCDRPRPPYTAPVGMDVPVGRGAIRSSCCSRAAGCRPGTCCPKRSGGRGAAPHRPDAVGRGAPRHAPPRGLPADGPPARLGAVLGHRVPDARRRRGVDRGGDRPALRPVRLLRLPAGALLVGRAPRDVADLPAPDAVPRSGDPHRARTSGPTYRRSWSCSSAAAARATRRPARSAATTSTSAGCSRSHATTG